LGIAALEDKIVQQAVVTVLNQIYEADFKGFSYGFRPGRGPHQALDALTVGIQRKRVNWVLDWNASGGYLEGTASIGADGTINTEGQNHGDANQLDRTRSTIRITADAWTFAPSYEKDRVWNSEPMRTYR
jgi:hypothetical protein